MFFSSNSFSVPPVSINAFLYSSIFFSASFVYSSTILWISSLILSVELFKFSFSDSKDEILQINIDISEENFTSLIEILLKKNTL